MRSDETPSTPVETAPGAAVRAPGGRAPDAAEVPAGGDPGDLDACLLAARLRTGSIIVLCSLVVFAAADVLVGQPRLAALLAIKVLQVAVLAGGIWVLRRPAAFADICRIGMGIVVAAYATTAMSAIVRNDVVTTCVLFLALGMGTATFLPWGMRHQLASVLAGGLSLLANVALVDRATAVGTLFPELAVAVGLVSSVWIARNDERHRRERRAFEREIEASRRRLEEESLVSGALARMGQAMIASANEPAILERVCALTTELLGCDTSTASLREAEDGDFAVRASHGYPPDDREAMRFVRAPAALVSAVVDAFETERTLELETSRIGDRTAASLHREYGVANSLYVPLRRGPDLVGVLSAHYRSGTARFSELQRRIAMGVAHLASMALENARLVDELRSANQVKSEFVSTMSHELRTPVSVILGYTEMLADLETADESRALLGRVRRAALELHELIEETLSLGRLDAGRDPPRAERVEVRELFDELAAEFTAVSPLASVDVRWEGPRALEIRSDRRKLRIILKNLLGNALKFTPAGEIVVSGRGRADAVEIAVADTGIGIAREHLPIIFEMFRQADSSDARSYPGVGLGLYIVRRLAAELGGEVAVESEVGRGSRFVVVLPQAGRGEGLEAAGDDPEQRSI